MWRQSGQIRRQIGGDTYTPADQVVYLSFEEGPAGCVLGPVREDDLGLGLDDASLKERPVQFPLLSNREPVPDVLRHGEAFGA